MSLVQSASPDGSAATVAVLTLVGLVLGAAVYCWYAVALAAVLRRLGAPGWRAWVPVLNEMELLERGGVPGWSVVYFFVPVVALYGLYLHVVAAHRITVRLGRGAGATVLALLAPPVWASLLGWSRATPEQDLAPRVASPTGLAAPTGPLVDESEMPLWAGAQPVVVDVPRTAPALSPWAPAGEPAPAPPMVQVPAPPIAQVPVAPAAEVPVGPVLPMPAAPVLPPAEASAPGWTAPVWEVPDEPVLPPPAGPAAAPTAWSAPTPVPPVAAPAAPPAPPAPPVATPAPPVPPAPPVAAPPVAPLPPVAPPTVLAPPVVSAPPAAPPPASPAQPTAAPALTAPPVFADPDDEDDVEGTVVVSRTPFRPWSLHLDDGRTFEVLGRAVVLGRRPVVTELGVQLLAVPDPTRTLSKTHARLDLVDDQWHVTDLGSTNGVLLVGADGTERPVDAGVPTPVAGRFVLGSVGMWLTSAADGAR